MAGDSLRSSVLTSRRRATGDDVDSRRVFDALGDPDCRRVLRAVADDALTASECAEAVDVPLSTTYRKLDLLAEAGLVEERIRLRRDGKHANEYRPHFASVCVSLADDGDFDVTVSRGTRGQPSSDP